MEDQRSGPDEPSRNRAPATNKPLTKRELLQSLDGFPSRASSAEASELSAAAQQLWAEDPQAAEQFRRRGAFDAAVAEAFAQVPLPLGLSARLTSALAAEAAAEAALPVTLPFPAAAAEEKLDRRRWFASAGSALAATAAGGALFVWWQNRSRNDLSLEQVLEASLSFHQRAAAKRAEAKPISQQPAPAAFPLSRYVTPRAEPRVRALDEPLLGRTGAVYELAPADQPRAALYVVSERPGLTAPAVPLLAAEPMAHPFMTGGCALSAWREGHRIVLLVVDGDDRRYREFLSAPKEFA